MELTFKSLFAELSGKGNDWENKFIANLEAFYSDAGFLTPKQLDVFAKVLKDRVRKNSPWKNRETVGAALAGHTTPVVAPSVTEQDVPF